jgi:desulfoferrodoxin-like iron-binding protein
MALSRRDFVKTLSLGTLSVITPAKALAGQDWFAQINRIKDPNNLTGKEKGHSPVIILPGNIQPDKTFVVKINVGKQLHVMNSSHYIRSIEMFVNDVSFARAEFSPQAPQPTVIFPCKIKGKSTIRVMSDCNLHGLWAAETAAG